MATKPDDDDFQWEVEDDADKPSIEVEDDTPEADRGRAPMPEEIVKELEADELEEYSDKVKTRLKQMKKVWHDERREKERYQRENNEALAAARAALEENRKLKASLSEGEQTLVGSFKQSAELELQDARRAYKDAYEAGDSDRVIEAQEKLTTAQYKLQRLEGYRPALQPAEEEVQIPQQQVQAPTLDSKTTAWQERNTWWGVDPEMTASALGLHQKLERERGSQFVGSDEYWQTIDKTMSRRFPEYFGESEKQVSDTPKPKSAPVVAPASRSTSSKKIVLKQSQLTIAKKLGLTPEQYAREVMKMER
jgi:murein DD-endopeptidase MepM/ murein hydrolase activator NlpD